MHNKHWLLSNQFEEWCQPFPVSLCPFPLHKKKGESSSSLFSPLPPSQFIPFEIHGNEKKSSFSPPPFLLSPLHVLSCCLGGSDTIVFFSLLSLPSPPPPSKLGIPLGRKEEEERGVTPSALVPTALIMRPNHQREICEMKALSEYVHIACEFLHV